MTSLILSIRTKKHIVFTLLQRIQAFCLLLAVFYTFDLSAQSADSTVFIQLGPYEGDATYQYAILDKDTVLEGAFKLEGAKRDSIDEAKTNYFKIKGQFHENKVDQEWEFELGSFKKSGESSMVDYNLQSKINGKLHKFSIDFDNAILNGKMKHQVYQIQNSEMTTAYFESEMIFLNGKLAGDYSLRNQELNLSASIRDGLAEGDWVFNNQSTEQIEKWEFTSGKLKAIQMLSNEKTKRIDVFSINYQDSAQIEVSGKFLQLVSLYLRLSNEEKLHGNVQNLVKLNDSLINEMEGLLSDLGVESHFSNPLVTVPFYSLDKKEIDQLNSIQRRIERSDSIQAEIRKNYQIRVLKHTNDTLLYCTKAIQLLEKSLIRKCKDLITLKEENILSFLPRSEIQSFLEIDSFPKELLVKYGAKDSKIYKLPINTNAIEQMGGLSSLEELSRISLESLDDLNALINRILSQYQVQKQLVILEEDILKKHDIYINYADSLILKSEDPYRRSIASIKSLIESKIDSYWSNQSSSDRLREASELLDCLNKARELTQSIIYMPIKKAEITKIYTSTIYNTFTYTNMAEIVKKKIYNTYSNILLPYFLNEINQNLTCSSTQVLHQNIELSHERMKELRFEKTSKLEKKLSRNISPQEALLLLGIIEKQ